MALWVSKGADVLEGTSWILSVFICMYRESCPEFMYTSTISSLYFPPSSFITQTVCLFVLAGSFPVIPPFPTLYSFYQSPAATWIEAYLDYMNVLLLKNRPKKVPRTLFWDNIFCLLFHCHFGWYFSGNTSSFGKFIEHSFSSSVQFGPDLFCFLETFSKLYKKQQQQGRFGF